MAHQQRQDALMKIEIGLIESKADVEPIGVEPVAGQDAGEIPGEMGEMRVERRHRSVDLAGQRTTISEDEQGRRASRACPRLG